MTTPALNDDLVREIEAAEWWERGDAEGNTVVSVAPERLAKAYRAQSKEMEALRAALEFYADPEHWRTRNASDDMSNKGYGLGYHRTNPDGMMEVLASNCGRWHASKFEVHGGHWQSDAGHVARTALKGA